MKNLVLAVLFLVAAPAKADIRLNPPDCTPTVNSINSSLDMVCVRQLGGACFAAASECTSMGAIVIARCDGHAVPGMQVCCAAPPFGFSSTPTPEEIKNMRPATKMLCTNVDADGDGGPNVDALNRFLKNPLFLTTSAPVIEAVGGGKYSACAVFSN